MRTPEAEQIQARLARLEEMERLIEDVRRQIEIAVAMLRHHPCVPKGRIH